MRWGLTIAHLREFVPLRYMRHVWRFLYMRRLLLDMHFCARPEYLYNV